ncbi:MAG: hypothetical protein RSB71_04430, partial [Bacilli bacterium]
MLNKVMIGRYYSISSRIHQMNPLAKIICTLLFIIMSFMSNNLYFNLIILFLLIIMLLNTKVA